MKRVGVAGCRDYSDYRRIAADLDTAHARWGDFVVVTGDAKGVDAAAVRWAKARGLSWVVHKADWDRHGLRAGPLRNRALVADCEAVIAFWDGASKGTASTIAIARRSGKAVFVRPVERRRPCPPGGGSRPTGS